MTGFRNLIIRPIDPSHDRKGFRCGVVSLDRYLKNQAGQDMKRRISRVFIAAEPEHPQKIIGYYTLSSLSIALEILPEKFIRKLPKHPGPAALVGRLAVSQSAQRHGIGKMLLADAIKRTLAVSDQIAIYAMVVDAVDDRASAFYEQFGFIRLGTDNPRLFLPMRTIGTAFDP